MPIIKPTSYNSDTNYYILHSGAGYKAPTIGNEIYITENDYYLIMHGSEPGDNLIAGLVYKRTGADPYTNLLDYYLNIGKYPILNIVKKFGSIYNSTPNYYLGNLHIPFQSDYTNLIDFYLGTYNNPYVSDYVFTIDHYFYNMLLYIKKQNYNGATNFYLGPLHGLFKRNYDPTTDVYLGPLHGIFKRNYDPELNTYLGPLHGIFKRNYDPTTDIYLKEQGLGRTRYGIQIPYVPLTIGGLIPPGTIPIYLNSTFDLPIYKMADYYLWGPEITLFTHNLSPFNKLEYRRDASSIEYKLTGESTFYSKDFYIKDGGRRSNNLSLTNKLLYRKLNLVGPNKYYSEADKSNLNEYITYEKTNKKSVSAGGKSSNLTNLEENRLEYNKTNKEASLNVNATVDLSNANTYSSRLITKYRRISLDGSFKRTLLLEPETTKNTTTMLEKYNYDKNDHRVKYDKYALGHIKSLLLSIIDSSILNNSDTLATKENDIYDLEKYYNLIKFYIEDVYNKKIITMPAYLLSLSDSGGTAKILTINYVNGIYPKFLYTGVEARKIDFTFKLVCSSRALLKNYAQKMNYLRSLTYPNFNRANTNIKFPIAPIVKLTIGDIVYEQLGMFESVLPKWLLGNTPWNIDGFEFVRDTSDNSFSIKDGIKSMQIPYITTVECSFIIMHQSGQQIGGRQYNLPDNWLKYEDLQWKYNTSAGSLFKTK